MNCCGIAGRRDVLPMVKAVFTALSATLGAEDARAEWEGAFRCLLSAFSSVGNVLVLTMHA